MATNVSMKEFLQLFYMQDLFINMPEAKFAQYQAYLKANDGNGDFRGNMKMWRDKGFVKNVDGKWERNYQYPGDQGTRASTGHPRIDPSPIQMEDKDWEKLFRELQTAFRDMSANRNDFKDNKDANEFLDEYFGADKLFSVYAVDNATEGQITTLYNILNTHRTSMYAFLADVFESQKDFDDFVDNISDAKKKYNTDPKVRDKLSRVVRGISHEMNWGDGFAKRPEIAKDMATIQIDSIVSGLDDKDKPINPNKLDYFKRNYQNILLGAKDDKVYDVFKNYSPSVANAVEHAKGKVDYNNTNSDDYIPAKRDDKLNSWQKIADWTSERWSDRMNKYTKLRGGHVYFSPQAKSIVNALDGAKFKPNDGLDKLLENAGKVKENLQYKSPSASAHFDWMVKKLGELKNKKMFKGALKNASQMKALVAELAIMALEDGKKDSEEAVKTAMEVLTVIKYGYVTSNVLDAMKKENLSIFSDKSLSWNKHEGMQFVTSAMDKSIKFAFLGAGYLLNGAGRFIKMRNKKFNAHRGKPNKYQKNFQAKTDVEKAELERKQRADRNQKARINRKLNAYRRAGTTEATLDADILTYNTNISAYQANLKTNMAYIEYWLSDPANETDPDYDNVNDFYNAAMAGPRIAPITVSTTDPYLQRSINDASTILNNINNTQAALDNATDKRREFQNGTDAVKMINAQMRERKAKLDSWDNDHQDKFVALMAHWDFLNSGRSRTGENILAYGWRNLMPTRQSARQDTYDKEKDRVNPFTGATEKMSKKELARLVWMNEHGYSNVA